MHPPRIRHPPDQAPPGTRHPYLWTRHPPGPGIPGPGTPLGPGTLRDQAPPPLEQAPLPRDQALPPEKRRLLLQTVRILLECILVYHCVNGDRLNNRLNGSVCGSVKCEHSFNKGQNGFVTCYGRTTPYF